MEDLRYELSKSIALFRTAKINNIDSKYINTSDFSVLVLIYNVKREISAVEICKYLGFSKVYASKVMKHLEEQKLIYRSQCDKDKRKYFLYLTEEGKNIVLKYLEKYMEITNYLYDQMGAKKVKEFTNMLDEATSILKGYQKSKK